MLRVALVLMFVAACAPRSGSSSGSTTGAPSSAGEARVDSPPAQESSSDASAQAATARPDASAAVAASYATDDVSLEARWATDPTDASRVVLAVTVRPTSGRRLNLEAPVSLAIDTADLSSFDAGARGRRTSPAAVVQRREQALAYAADGARFVLPRGEARAPLRLVVDVVVDTSDSCIVVRPVLPLASP